MKNYSPVNIFTTNYDLFNEVAMEDLGIHYTNGFTGTVKRIFSPSVFQLRLVDDENRYKDKWSVFRRYIKLYKIHGSIDWKYDSKSESVIQSNIKEADWKDTLIYPTINKHLETQQSPYSELFRSLTINLQKPNSTLIVMGYGFPDEHINNIFSQSLMNDDFTLIVFGNKDEEGASKFIRKHQNKQNFHFIGGNINIENDAHFFSNIIDYINGGHNNEE
ncbi:SIR2 family protein [Bacillus haynesii]|uniref:SIR2 family protein n=1 Tax=Bacillus haynesii TaxID=1925021 RepID=UPI00227EAB14|nr:SIR2 family protein [Bacillus haynesii]MCY8373218.1 SIR2 family protein [Bacillus haynesii]MCY8673116.1 SIR2 family protein [Bacillus haynesii]